MCRGREASVLIRNQRPHAAAVSSHAEEPRSRNRRRSGVQADRLPVRPDQRSAGRRLQTACADVAAAGGLRCAEVRELAPIVRGDDILGGTFCPSDGIASPHAVTPAYAGAAKRLGVKIHEGVAVTGIDVRAGRVSAVTTSAGDIVTPVVFNCAGAWAGEIGKMAGVTVPVEPYPRNIFVTAPMPAVTRDHPMTIDMTTSFYFHPEGDGLLFGMGLPNETPSFDTEVDWAVLEAMADIVERRAPALGTAGVRTAWAGLYEVTPDHQPILGAVDDLGGFWC